jgi:hypothetical protein
MMVRYRFGLALLLGVAAIAPVWGGGSAPEPLVLKGVGRGHTQRIYRGVFTPDSKAFLSVGIDAVVRAWNVSDGAPLYTLTGHTGSIHGVGLVGENMLVTGSESGELFLWDLARRKKIGKLGKTKHPLHCLAVSHDGKLLATGGGTWGAKTPGELRLWDLESREEITLLEGHRRLVLGVAFSADDQLLAAVDYSGSLHVWNLVTRKPVVTLFLEKPAGAVAFSPDGKLLVVGDYRARLNVWDTTHWLDEGVVRSHPGGVMWLQYAPRGNLLASAGWDGTVKLWNGYDVEAVPPVRVTEHKDKAWMVAFSPDGKTLATAGEDRLVKFWAIPAEFARRYVPPTVPPPAPPTPARTGAARVALVTAQPLEAARTLQDLALVTLSKEKGIDLLQRDAMDKLLAEQKLSLSGLVEAKSAVQLGKILAVDCLGVIDVSLEAKEALGFVLFDATTGARLYDDGFAEDKTEQQLRAIVKGVQAGVQKWRAGTKQLKTVCVLPARNADLPRSMDAYCEALGAALERQLLQHPSITTLERKWLDSVNQEKTIASAALARELLASVLVIDLEIARSPQGKGVRATINVRDNAGKVLHTLAHQVADENGAELLGPLLKRLHAALDTAQGSALVKPSREARRFAHESEMLWKHGHFRQALQAAEAAYGLVPDDDARLRLAECLMQYPREMWRKKAQLTERNRFPPVERTAEEVRAGLGMVRRGQQLIDSAKPRVNEMPDNGWFYSRAESGPCFQAEATTWEALKAITITPADPSIGEDILEFRKACLRRNLDRLAEIVALKKGSPRGKLQRLTLGLRSNFLHNFQEFAPDAAAYKRALRQAARIWLELAAQIPREQFPVETAAAFADSVMYALYALPRPGSKLSAPDADTIAPILKALTEHAHPLLRLYGSHYQMKQQLAGQQIARQQAEQRFRDNLDAAKRWIDQAPFNNPDPHRLAFYEFFSVVLPSAQLDLDGKLIDELYVALAEYMLDRKDVPGHVTTYIAGHNLINDRSKLFARLQLIRRFKEMYAAPEHRLFSDPLKNIARQLSNFEATILRIDPALAKQQQVVPWDQVIRLAEADKLPSTSRFYTPVRHENHVYFLAGVHDPADKKKVYLELKRVALSGGAVVALSKLPITLRDYDGKNPLYAFNYANCVVQSVIHNKYFIAGTARDGVYVFPLEGGAPGRIGEKEGLPAEHVDALTAQDNQIVASLEGGYLVQIDLATRRIEVLASSRRTNKLSPFDNDRPFYVRTILADPERQRVLFPVGLASFTHPNTGMWEYNLTTRQFKKHLPMPWFHFSEVQAGVVYLQHNQREWLARYDLAKDRFTVLEGRTPDGLEKQQPAGLPKDFSALFNDRLYHGGFLWETSPLERRPLGSNNGELLPHPGRERMLQVYVRECLEPIGPRELLVGDWRGLYVVRLKK